MLTWSRNVLIIIAFIITLVSACATFLKLAG